MTNAEKRRASGAANEAARRAGDGAAARRASGDAMIERRTGRTQVDEINALVNQPRVRKQLKTIGPRGALPAQTSPGTDTPNPKASPGGGGLASPLTEPSFAAREFWPTGLRSSDGLFFLPAEKKVVMQDAEGSPAVFEYANPAPPVTP